MAIKREVRPLITHIHNEYNSLDFYYFSMTPTEYQPLVDPGHQETFYFQTDDKYVEISVRKEQNAFANWFLNMGYDNKQQQYTYESHKKMVKGAIYQIHFNFMHNWKIDDCKDPARLKAYVDDLVRRWEKM